MRPLQIVDDDHHNHHHHQPTSYCADLNIGALEPLLDHEVRDILIRNGCTPEEQNNVFRLLNRRRNTDVVIPAEPQPVYPVKERCPSREWWLQTIEGRNEVEIRELAQKYDCAIGELESLYREGKHKAFGLLESAVNALRPDDDEEYRREEERRRQEFQQLERERRAREREDESANSSE